MGASRRGSHRLADALKCKRIHAFATLKLHPLGTKNALALGTLVHTHLAYHYARQLPELPEWAKQRTLEEQLAIDAVGVPELAKQAAEVYEWYADFWRVDPMCPAFVEEEFVVALGELGVTDPDLRDEVISCRSDLVVEQDGALWIMDHKTTSYGGRNGRLANWSPDGSEWSRSWQGLINLLCVRTRLPQRVVAGFGIQRIKVSYPFDCDRRIVPASALAYRDVIATVVEAIRAERAAREALERGTLPAPNLSACFGRYGDCAYGPLCWAADDESQDRVAKSQYVIGERA